MTKLLETERVLGRCSSRNDGPLLVAVGGIHGNEPAGVHALRRVLARFGKDGTSGPALERGDLVALAGNREALRAGKRFLDRDLNRNFDLERSPPRVENVERRERRELLDALGGAFAAARGPVYLLDLHTTSGKGAPFAVFADTIPSRRFARRFPIPIVLGLEEQIVGTLIDFVGQQGHVAVGFEGGQHEDPLAVTVLESIVWLALGELSLVDGRSVSEARRVLVQAAAGAPRYLEVTYRHALSPSDGFRMYPGLRSFEPVRRGRVVAEDVRGPVAVPDDGYLLMPLYQQQGDDGFFLVRRVRVFWLWVSALLRYARMGRFAHWLPGVSRVEGHPRLVRVDRSVARFYSLEILHLLGFRRRAERGDELVMERRPYDVQ